MTRFALAILATLLLAGCETEKEQVFATCRAQSYNAPKKDRREMITACMEGKGYQRQPCGYWENLILNHRLWRYLNASCFTSPLDSAPVVEWMPL
jgi:hypothetical protein